MTLPLYQIDAFTSKLFGGNPLQLYRLKNGWDTSVLQNIAA